ncbi:MAG: VTT domain-containing protein [Chloroflexi bacterium]|nr:VTT domain-containing protein [Chloroflexota bacterium]
MPETPTPASAQQGDFPGHGASSAAGQPSRWLRARGALSGRRWTRWLALGLALGITLAAFVAGDYFGTLKEYGYLGVFLIMVISSATIILPVPGAVAIFLLGSTLDPWLLGLVAGLGGAIGETTGYMAGYGGGMVLEGRPIYDRLAGWMHRRGGITISLVGLVWLVPFDVVGIMAGALHYPLWRFYVFSALGKTPRFILIAWGGAWGIDFLRRLVGL